MNAFVSVCKASKSAALFKSLPILNQAALVLVVSLESNVKSSMNNTEAVCAASPISEIPSLLGKSTPPLLVNDPTAT